MIFANVIKPTHICNLACTYCYNDDVRDPIMKDGVLARTIQQTFEYAASRPVFKKIEFIWHGGEPMVPGLGFYERVVAMQESFKGDIPYQNLIQTNGILINDKWLEFFKEHKFAVSISIDGPKALHDVYRLTHKGEGSFDRVFRAINMVRDAGLPIAVCMVMSRATIDKCEELLEFFSANRLHFEVIPMTRSGAARDNFADLGLDPEEYGRAWCKMYDLWMDLSGEDYVQCADFINKTRSILYGMGMDCFGLANCSHSNVSTDPVGDVFPCATLSGTDTVCYGNIAERDFSEILLSPAARDFQTRGIDPECARCDWQHVCHGGCVSRSYKFHGDIHKRDYYCPSLYMMYEHVATRLKERGIEPGAQNPFHNTNGIDPVVFERLHSSARTGPMCTAG